MQSSPLGRPYPSQPPRFEPIGDLLAGLAGIVALRDFSDWPFIMPVKPAANLEIICISGNCFICGTNSATAVPLTIGAFWSIPNAPALRPQPRPQS